MCLYESFGGRDYGGSAEWEEKAMQGQKCTKLQRSLSARQSQDEDSSGRRNKSSYAVANECSGTLGQEQFMGMY